MKDNKKEVKQIIKTNREALDEITNDSAAVSKRLEGQISKIGDNIAQSNSELQQSLANITTTLQGLLTPRNANQEPVIRQNVTQRDNIEEQPHQEDLKTLEGTGRPKQHVMSYQEDEENGETEQPVSREN